MFGLYYFIIRGRSCITQLVSTLEDWTTILDGGGQLDAIYMDFMKAFDTVPHQRLLQKLRSNGISGKIIRWIESFLCHRTQKVVIRGSQSGWTEVTSGIPQGSVLGPAIFLTYINDLPEVSSSPLVLFADDTKLYCQINSVTDCQDLQSDLDNLQAWADKWQMRFHPQKCKVMRIGTNHPEFEYTMTENQVTTVLEMSQVEKDLGVLVDNKLTFQQHVNSIANRGNQMLGIIRRSFEYLDDKIMLLLYKGLLRPILEYGNTIWAPYHKQDIHRVEAVQRRATKLIPSLKDLPYEERLKQLKLPSLAHRQSRGDMINVYKYLHGLYSVPNPPLHLTQHRVTRGHSLKLQKYHSRLDTRKYFFSNRIINPWNSLPEHIVQAPTLNVFKNKLDKHWQTIAFNCAL